MGNGLYELPCKVEKVEKKILPLKEKITPKVINIPKTDKKFLNEQKVAEKPVIFSNWKQNTIKIIDKYENNHEIAYCDELYWDEEDQKYYKDYWLCENGGRRSIGFGTISFKGEVITLAEGKRRMEKYVSNMFPLIENNTCYNDNQKTAIADFMYNAGAHKLHNITEIPFINYVNDCNYIVIEGFLAPYNYKAKGLKVRRLAEYNFWRGIEKI